MVALVFIELMKLQPKTLTTPAFYILKKDASNAYPLRGN
jgi:hypothetical protein